MNFLAHALLAGPAPADRLGGVLGDFVKGPLRPLPAGVSPALADGLELHRRIDGFADSHQAFRRSRARVSVHRRRYAGIMVDMFYDHFLAVHWGRFCDQPLGAFAAAIYGLLEQHRETLPPAFVPVLPLMQGNDWLASYAAEAAVARALDRMAEYRLRRPNRLAGGGEELRRDYRGFEADFLDFFPDASAFSAAVRAARPASAFSAAE